MKFEDPRLRFTVLLFVGLSIAAVNIAFIVLHIIDSKDPAGQLLLTYGIADDESWNNEQFLKDLRLRLISISPEDQGELISSAAKKGYTNFILALLKNNVPVDARTASGRTALMSAIGARQHRAVEILLANNADTNAYAPNGPSVAELAQAARMPILIYLLADRHNILDIDQLTYALRKGHFEELKRYVDKGLNLNVLDARGWSPLATAIASNRLHLVRYLLEHGANADVRNADGLSPSTLAVLSSNAEAMELMLQSGAQPNELVFGEPLLSLAVATGHDHIVRLLRHYGADPNMYGEGGGTPTELAVALQKDKAIDALLEFSDEANAQKLFLALRSKNVEAVRKLLANGVNANTPYESNWRPIHIAAALGDERLISVLIQSGADISAVTSGAQTVLHIAAISRAPEEVLKAIRDEVTKRAAGHIFAAKDNVGRTALMYAVMHGQHASIKYLIPDPKGRFPLVVDAPGRGGIRPATISALRMDNLSLDELMSYGASISHPGENVSLHDIARQKKNWLMLARLPSDRKLSLGINENMTRDEIAQYQKELTQFGYYRGNADSEWGPSTQAATRLMLEDLYEQFKNIRKVFHTSIAGNNSGFKRYDGTTFWSIGNSFGEDVPGGWALIQEAEGEYFGQWGGVTLFRDGRYRIGFGIFVNSQNKRFLIPRPKTTVSSNSSKQDNTSENANSMYGDWGAQTFLESGNRGCSMWSQPMLDVGRYINRGAIYSYVTHRPWEKRLDEVSFEAGYSYKVGSVVEVEIGGEKYSLFTKGSTAWTKTPEDDRRLVSAMIREQRMIVKGISNKGTVTIDTYSLKGFSAAHNFINHGCKIR